MWPEILDVGIEELSEIIFSEKDIKNLRQKSIVSDIFLGNPNGNLLCLIAKDVMEGKTNAMTRYQTYVRLSRIRLNLEKQASLIKLCLTISIALFYFFISWSTFILITIIDIGISYYLRKLEIESGVRNQIRGGQY